MRLIFGFGGEKSRIVERELGEESGSCEERQALIFVLGGKAPETYLTENKMILSFSGIQISRICN